MPRGFRALIPPILVVLVIFAAAWWHLSRPEKSPMESAALTSPATPTKVASPAGGPAAADQAGNLMPVSLDPAPAAAPRPLPDTDVRAAARPRAAARTAVEAEFKRRHADVAVDLDPVTGSPKWVASNTRLLTGPSADPDAAIRTFLEENRALFGHDAAVLEGADKAKDYVTGHNGIRTAIWQQRFEGLEVFEAIFKANQTARGEIISLGSQLVPDPAAAAASGAPGYPALLEKPPITPQRAVSAAAENIGDPVAAEKVAPIDAPAATPERKQGFKTARHTDVTARLVWVPLSGDALRPAWEVVLMSKTRGEMYRVLVDAENAEVLVRQALTNYLSPATYRVFTTESPTPFSPGHETPSSLQPPYGNRVLLTLDALNTTASPNGWINDGQMETNGNNVDAHTDTNNDNSPDLPRTNGGAGRVFDFPINFALAPSTYKEASVTQLFYWCNFMHDRMYELGFTEEAGNFQVDNFGRGGFPNDPVQADAQDGSGSNNANFSTPRDGTSGRMQMYVFTGPTPDRDSSFEAEMVLHEYGHGVSNRLVGGGVGTTALATRGMGEGWSDFYALALLASETDDPHGNCPLGAYVEYRYGGWVSENYYFGMRRYSYSTDLPKNPHTFRDIDPTQVDWHTSIPRNPTHAATQDATQVHYQGTVWCTMLGEVRANLIAKHGFIIGNERALRLVTDGMKLGPANPNFVQARDGIVQAALVGAPSDLGEVWAAFAKRGLGYGATAPASTTTTGLVESFKVPDALQLSDRRGWTVTGNLGGPFTPTARTVTLTNTSGTALNWGVATNAPWLGASPASGTLGASASVVVTFTAQAELMPSGSHHANVVFTNSTTLFHQPIGVRLTVTPPRVQSFSLDADPGWARTGEWAFGPPLGGGGGFSPPDPTSGATGANVFGVNLAGIPTGSSFTPFYVTTGPIDLSTRARTRLRFQRWLNTDAGFNSRATVEVSTDGATWREVFVNPAAPTTQNAWRLMDYDISSIADGQSAVRVRWGYQTNLSNYTGWNIDDVEILGESTAQFTIALADSASEGAASLTATLQITAPQLAATTVTLASSDPAVATVPPTLTLLPNQQIATFVVTPVDDAMLDGSQATTISAVAPGLRPSGVQFTVHDNESASVALSAPASATEGQSGLVGSVSVSAVPAADVAITLAASDGALAAPSFVTIPAGSVGPVSFPFNAPEDALAAGGKVVTLMASVAGWTPGTAVVAVADNDVATLVLAGQAQAREGDAAKSFTATVNTPLAADLLIALASGDPSEVTVPASVTIPAGQLSATFSATILDDALRDGVQSASISATAAGYPSAPATITVSDNDVDRYTFASVPTNQRRDTPFPIVITARDLNGGVVFDHSGTVTLTASSPGGAVPISPGTVSGFDDGAAHGSLAAAATATSVVLTATDDDGRTGTSNSFNVTLDPLASFVWSGLPASATIDTNLTPTVTAKDQLGATLTSYTDPTALDLWLAFTPFGLGGAISTNTTSRIYNTAFHDSRVTILCMASELGPAKWLGGLAFILGTAGGQPMSNLTVRMKQTTLATLNGAAWEDEGWQTVFSNASGAASTTLYQFIQPIYYDGVKNMLVDVSFNNASASTAGTLRFTSTAGTTVMSGTSNSLNGNPLNWAGTTNPAPQYLTERPVISFYVAKPVGSLAGSPVVFSGGAWTGTASVPVSGAAASAWLRAESPSGVIGFSGRVGLTSSFQSGTTDAVFSDNFESGALSGAWVTTGGSGAPRLEVSSANSPRGNYHLQFDSDTSGSSYSRSQAAITLNLANRTNVTLYHYAKGFFDEAHSAPALQPFGTSTNFDGIAISPDGTNWYLARNFAGLTSAYGANTTIISLDPIMQQYGLSYTSAFCIKFVQYDDQAIPNDGIAIDDFSVRTNASNSVIVELPPTLPEGGTNIPVTVRLPTPATTATNVTLSSVGPARLVVPSSVSVPAGSSTGTILVSTPDNPFFDGGKAVYVVASAPSAGYGTGITYTRILDNEQGTLSVTLPISVTEGGPNATGTVSVTPMSLNPVVVALTSSDPTEATVPASVTIAAGATSANFAVAPVNDPNIDGTRTVSVTASGVGVVAGAATIDVLDDESTDLTLVLPAEIREGGPAGIGRVSIAGPRTADLIVSFTSETPAEVTVPATVTIPAGALTVDFPITPVDDSFVDGTQHVNISASALGFIGAIESLAVGDNEAAYFEWATIASPQAVGESIPVTLTAKSIAGETQVYFAGSVSLSAASGVAPSSVTPAAATAFIGGIWKGNLLIAAPASGVVFTARSGGTAGFSNPFDVGPAGVDSDHDGMGDAYEMNNGLHPFDDGMNDPLRGPLGDLDFDGVRNILEYAFNTPANVPGGTGLPAVSKQLNGADGETYPVLTYRRRITPGALGYFVETAPNLAAWSVPGAAQIEQIGSAVPTGDGVTETVQFRLKPSLDDSAAARFVRVGVSLASP
jgi:hypothetical protein